MQKKKFFFISLLFLFLLINFDLLSNNSVESLRHIPTEDLEALSGLFSYLIKEEQVAHTLFGEKPISCATLTIRNPIVFIPTKIRYYSGKFTSSLWAQWQVWKRYESLFHINEFIIIEEHTKYSSKIKYIIIINKKLFIKTIEEYLWIFQKKLSKAIQPEKLLKEIEEKKSLTAVIQDDDLLFGILLGYGEHNAKLYQKRESMRKLHKVYQNLLMKKSGFLQRITENIDTLTNILQPVESCFFPFLSVGNVRFVADHNHDETIKLKKKYREWQNKISAFLSEKNILNITLDCLEK